MQNIVQLLRNIYSSAKVVQFNKEPIFFVVRLCRATKKLVPYFTASPYRYIFD